MIETRTATESERQAWLAGWRDRLRSRYDVPARPAGWAARRIQGCVSRLEEAPETAVTAVTAMLTSSGDVAGILAVSAADVDGLPAAFISDVWVAPAHRRAGYGSAAVRLAEDWAARRRLRAVWLMTEPGELAQAGLSARYPVRSQQMIRELTGPGDLAAGLAGRAMTESEHAAWRAVVERGYAADVAGSGSMPAGQAAAAARASFDELLPGGLSTAGHSFLCLCADGEVVATNWVFHHHEPSLSWVYAVDVHEQHRGRGYGRAAMLLGERAALDAGDTHLGLNVFGHNAIAIGLYDAMGYQAYDQARSLDIAADGPG